MYTFLYWTKAERNEPNLQYRVKSNFANLPTNYFIFNPTRRHYIKEYCCLKIKFSLYLFIMGRPNPHQTIWACVLHLLGWIHNGFHRFTETDRFFEWRTLSGANFTDVLFFLDLRMIMNNVGWGRVWYAVGMLLSKHAFMQVSSMMEFFNPVIPRIIFGIHCSHQDFPPWAPQNP